MKIDRPTKVLVIDDDEIARELLGSELRKAGLQVLALPSPIGATRMIQENEIDAVVIDVVMPAMSGDRLATLLRNNPRFSKLAVVLVSGDSSVELERLASSIGADAVVSKKFIRQTLVRSVVGAVRGRAAQLGATQELGNGAASGTKAQQK